MTYLEIVQKGINYIEANLLEDINYEDVANFLNISSFEFHRNFSIIIGMTVSLYIRNRRLSLAGVELTETDEKVIDVALKYGYETPESFNKAFTRFHGISPKLAKKQGVKLSLFNPLVIKIKIEGGKMMDYRMEVKEEQKFLCLSKSFSNEEGNNDIPNFWSECHQNNLINELTMLRPEGKKDLFGLCLPLMKNKSSFDYGIGILIDKDTKHFDQKALEDKGYKILTTQKQQYVVFECFGDDGNCISEAWDKFFKEFLPQMGYEASTEIDFEVYYENGKENLFCELWIPIKKM